MPQAPARDTSAEAERKRRANQSTLASTEAARRYAEDLVYRMGMMGQDATPQTMQSWVQEYPMSSQAIQGTINRDISAGKPPQGFSAPDNPAMNWFINLLLGQQRP